VAGQAAGTVEARREVPTLEEVEAAHIRSALERAGWVVEGPRGAAAELDLNASTLRFRMKRLGIQRPG
jgi:formate hydrogenlyase transcriptional activator